MTAPCRVLTNAQIVLEAGISGGHKRGRGCLSSVTATAQPQPGPVQQLPEPGDRVQSRLELRADRIDPDPVVTVEQAGAIQGGEPADVGGPAMVVPQQQEQVRRGSTVPADASRPSPHAPSLGRRGQLVTRSGPAGGDRAGPERPRCLGTGCRGRSSRRGGPFTRTSGLTVGQDAGVWLTIQRMP